MTISLNHSPAISFAAKRISQETIRFIGSFGSEDLVVGAGEEEDGDPFETLDVVGECEIGV